MFFVMNADNSRVIYCTTLEDASHTSIQASTSECTLWTQSGACFGVIRIPMKVGFRSVTAEVRIAAGTISTVDFIAEVQGVPGRSCRMDPTRIPQNIRQSLLQIALEKAQIIFTQDTLRDAVRRNEGTAIAA